MVNNLTALHAGLVPFIPGPVQDDRGVQQIPVPKCVLISCWIKSHSVRGFSFPGVT